MVLVLVGLPGCGKTTFAQQLGPTPGGWTVVAVWMKEGSFPGNFHTESGGPKKNQL